MGLRDRMGEARGPLHSPENGKAASADGRKGERQGNVGQGREGRDFKREDETRKVSGRKKCRYNVPLS